jgi:DNA invertase Pin-like site-specific DNA recombinase
MTPRPPNAALYVRASTDHQKYSTANQAAALNDYADAHGMPVVRTYEDDGQSGVSLRGRTALVQLLQDVMRPSPEFDVLLVYDVSRWGRFQDADESAYYEYHCKRAGVRLIYVAEPFENDNGPMANVVKAIKRAMAAEYSRELSRKVSIGQLRMAALGHSQGGRANYGLARVLVDEHGTLKGPLAVGQSKGFLTDHVRIAPGCPKQIVIVQRIYDLFVRGGLSETAIARQLDAEAVPPPDGPRWWALTVRNILKNEKYTGTFVYNRTSLSMNQPRRRKARQQWVRKEGIFKGIVSQELFDQAQKIFAKRPKSRSDETMLGDLRALYVREGRLSKSLINRDKELLSAGAYESRFGKVTNAYVLVGYVTPECTNQKWWSQRTYRPEDLLEKLKELLARKGSLTKRVIQGEPGFPRASSYERAFGSLSQAYRLIGFDPVLPGPKPSKARMEIPFGWPKTES